MPVLAKFGGNPHRIAHLSSYNDGNGKLFGKCEQGYQYLFRAPWQYNAPPIHGKHLTQHIDKNEIFANLPFAVMCY